MLEKFIANAQAAISTFQAGDDEFEFVDIAKAAATMGGTVDRLPYTVRVLLENVMRHHLLGPAARVSERDIEHLFEWPGTVGRGIPLHVARVILPDSSGVPVLQDLAALRDAAASVGADPRDIDMRVPVDLVVDHSLQVDFAGSADAQVKNLEREFGRNAERYRFLKWAQSSFRGLTLHPPGTGIIHQVNLEYIARVVCCATYGARTFAFPDFVIGGDSHTPMVNALGVMGWGVGGIDAEAALLGEAYTFPIPDVVGVRLHGTLAPGRTTTDLALCVTQTLRAAGVAGAIVEFHGPAVASLSVPERATLANMAPEYGATCGFFAVDAATIEYLRQTGRSAAQIELVHAYCKANHLFREGDEQGKQPQYTRIIEIDVGAVQASMAGPRRPQDRLALSDIAGDFRARLHRPLAEGGFAVPVAPKPSEASVLPEDRSALTHGQVVLAAITSCTNTSNPSVMLMAGLLARKAVERGLKARPWVKTSLAPGSRVVTHYLEKAGLLDALEQLGFYVIGYGCTTCGGKSGPLPATIAETIEQDNLVTVAVLSGNRNFEGRIHRLIRANYIGSPPLVLAYALAGRIDIDFEREALGAATDGSPVYLADLWPSAEEVEALLPLAREPLSYEQIYLSQRSPSELWQSLAAPQGVCFPWELDSEYLVEPPFFKRALEQHEDDVIQSKIENARVLAAFGDSLTTDHISPGGEIPPDTPSGRYLREHGIEPADFNTYVSRRGNHEVMTRATFANVRIKNMLLPEVEGGLTRHFPSRRVLPIFDAASAYRAERVATLILAGREYGTGSSRDWAAKGSALLGIKIVIAESFERIHRANLVGMGIVPLQFEAGQSWQGLGLTGEESFTFEHLRDGMLNDEPVRVQAREGGRTIRFTVRSQVLTDAEKDLLLRGGMAAAVTRSLTAGQRP